VDGTLEERIDATGEPRRVDEMNPERFVAVMSLA
jgi:hypothetical protein